MSALFFLVWLVSLVAFIVFWRKKVNAKKSAGDSFASDENYLLVSKTKKIIGAVCAASFVLMIIFSGGSDTSSENKTQVTENKPTAENKSTAENNLIGEWYSVEKDSSGIVTSITFLKINDEKSAQIDSYELTNTKFAENEPNKILWRCSSLNVEMKRGGKNLEFIVKIPDGDDVKVLECKYDSSEQKLTADKNIFTKDAVDITALKNENIQQYKNFLEGKGEKIEILDDMSESEYKDYLNKKIFGLP